MRWTRTGLSLVLFFMVLSLLTGDKLNKSINKFDIKMAKSIEQRLDDVKGIDEIKDEI